jgi:hypothetical protein
MAHWNAANWSKCPWIEVEPKRRNILVKEAAEALCGFTPS